MKIQKTIRSLKKNIGMVSLIVCLVAGLIFGTLSAKNINSRTLNGLDFIFASNFGTRINGSMMSNFITSISASFIFILASFLVGLSIWGFIFTPAICFFRGFGIGLSTGYLCVKYALAGFIFNTFILLPGVFISSVGVLMLCLESTRFSLYTASEILPIKIRVKSKSTTLNHYFFKTGISLIIIVAAAIIDILFAAVFAGLFDFS